MPKLLPQRCSPDSIREFRLAAEERFQDGLCMAAAGRRTAAVYVWGYAVEMTLKAAYFQTLGFLLNQTIALSHLHGAKANAPALGVVWQGNNLHSIESWAELLVATRATQPGWAYANPAFAGWVVGRARSLGGLWRETLRYRKNVAYAFEVVRAKNAAEWFLLNGRDI